MEPEELERKLREEIPPEMIRVHFDGKERINVIYDDYLEISVRYVESEQEVVREYIGEVAACKARCSLRLIRWSDGSNGHHVQIYERR